MNWLKILLAALTVAPELIQTGKQVLNAGKKAVKPSVGDSSVAPAAPPPPPPTLNLGLADQFPN